MKCKKLKITTKKGIKYGYCKLHNKEVSIFCNKCPFEIKYDIDKINKSKLKSKTNKPINKKSNKLSKAEKDRFSIIYQDLSKCCVEGCLTPYYKVEKNEVFEGAYRQLSIKHGMVCPFCKNHHDLFHNDRKFALYYKIMFESKFIDLYSYEIYMKIFKIDYQYRI